MRTVGLVCLLLVVLEAAADVLPDRPIVWLVTPLRLVIAVGLLALLVSALREGWTPLRRRPGFDLAVLALVAAATLPTLTGGQWSLWRSGLTAIAVGYLTMAVRRSGPQAWDAIALAGFAAVAVAALSGIRQTATGMPTGFCRGALDGSADSCGESAVLVRAIGTFANPNLLAAFLLLVLPLAVTAAMAFAHPPARRVGFVLAALGGVALVLTGSRGGLLGAAAGGLAAWVLWRPTARRLLTGAGLAAVAAGGLGVVAVSGFGSGVRADVWRAAAELVAAHPLGVGLGRSGALLDAKIPGDERFQHAHNLWLDQLLVTGWLGLAAALALTGVVAVHLVRTARRGSVPAIVTGSALAAFAAASLVDHPANADRIDLALWVLIGLAMTAGHPTTARDSPPAPPTGQARPARAAPERRGVPVPTGEPDDARRQG